MNTHTPGPWEIEEDLDNYKITAKDRNIAFGPSNADREADANLRLITCAPDLLELCEALVPLLDHGDYPENCQFRLATWGMEVIAKAKGGSK